MIKAVILDLDGTLADTMDDLLTAMNSMLKHLGYKERTRDELLSFINKGARLFVGRSLPEEVVKTFDDPIVTKALGIYSEYYSKCYSDKTHEYEGITEELLRLKEKGILLGVLSNKQDRFVKDIVYKLFPGIFECVRGQTELPEKPDPSGAFAVAKELGVSPFECAFVGDSDVDIKTALNAEMKCVGVSWGYRDEECLKAAGAEYIVREVSSLADVLLSL